MKHILLALTLTLVACSSSNNGGNSTPSISSEMMFEQGNPGQVDVRVSITETAETVGFVPNAAFLTITADFGTLGDVTTITVPGALANQFSFSATLTHPVTDSSGDNWTGEIPITARYLDSANNLDSSITAILSALEFDNDEVCTPVDAQ